MYKPAGLLKIFNADTSRPVKQVSTSVTVLYAAVQVVFGLNFGFFAAFNKTTRVVAKYISLLITLCLLIAIVSQVAEWEYFEFFVYGYFYIVLLFLCCSKYSVYQFLKDLLKVDDKWKINITDFNVGIKVCLYLGIMACIRLVLSIYVGPIFCVDSRTTIKFVLHELVTLCMDTLHVVKILIYLNVTLRLKYLRNAYKKLHIKNKDLETMFKAVSDCFEKIRGLHDGLVVIGLVADSLRWITIMWAQVVFIRSDNPLWNFQVVLCIIALLLTLQICLPPLFAEMTSAEVDAMNMIVHERLLLENDESVVSELTRLLRYMEARPLLRKACRLVPVDLRLPVTLLSMNATYLIVLLQFSHLV